MPADSPSKPPRKLSGRRVYYMIQKGDAAQQARFTEAAERDGFREIAPWFRHIAEARAAVLGIDEKPAKKRSR